VSILSEADYDAMDDFLRTAPRDPEPGSGVEVEGASEEAAGLAPEPEVEPETPAPGPEPEVAAAPESESDAEVRRDLDAVLTGEAAAGRVDGQALLDKLAKMDPEDPFVEVARALVERQIEGERQGARKALEAEVAEAVGDDPYIQRAWVYQAIAQNPSLTARQIVGEYRKHFEAVEKAAIDRYEKSRQPAAPAPAEARAAAPPRPGPKSGVATAPRKDGPKTIADVTRALWEQADRGDDSLFG
jgi:hypothetical protein